MHTKFLTALLFSLGIFLGGVTLAGAVSLFTVQQGGTGKGTFTSSQLLYGNGTNALSSVATTTASCSGSASCTPFTVIGSSPITITASGGSSTFGTTSVTASTPLSWNTSTAQLSISQATTLANGYLSTTDFNTFNNKISSTSLSVTTVGTSGAATYNSSTGVFNIPQYSGGGATQSVSTSTNETAGFLPYWTSNSATPALLGKVATGTVSGSGGITATAGQSIIGSGLTIGCTTATASVAGCLAAADFTTFAAKLGSYDPFTHPSAGVSATTSGIIISASSTIGSGTQIGGLTINGGATTTANAYFANLVSIGSTSPFAKFAIHANNGGTQTTLFAIGSSTQGATTTLFSISNTGLVTTANDLNVNPAGSTLTNPRIMGIYPDFNSGEGARFPIGAAGIGFQSGFNQRLAIYTYWSAEIRGGRQSTSAPSYVAGASTDPSLIVYGANADANDIIRLVNNGGTATLDVFNNKGYLGIGSSTPTTSNLVVQNNFGSVTTNVFTVASSTNSTGTTLINLFSVSNTGVASSTSLLVSSQGGAATACAQFAVDGTLSRTAAACGSGTVTAVSVATANGFAGSSGGGATPALTLSTTITGLLKGNGTAISAATYPDFPTISANSVLANISGSSAAPSSLATSSLFTFPWSIANGGTNQTTFSTSNGVTAFDGTRFVNFSGYTLTSLLLTATNASTSQITVSSGIQIPNAASSPSLSVAGYLALDTTAASSSLRFGDGTATRALYAAQTGSMVIASSSLAYMGAYGAAGTTTIAIQTAYRPTTILGAYCKTDTGTANVNFYNGTVRTVNVACSTTPTFISFAANNTWTMGQTISVEVGRQSSNPNTITVTAQVRNDAD